LDRGPLTGSSWIEVVGKEVGVRFREVCEYPDGGRVVVETTLEMRGRKIFRQVDVVARDTPADRVEEIGQSPPGRKPALGERDSNRPFFYAPSRPPKRRISV